jgi:hypothetical protein
MWYVCPWFFFPHKTMGLQISLGIDKERKEVN